MNFFQSWFAKPQQPIGLSLKAVQCLTQDFEQLRSLGPQLPERVLRFVLHGGEDSVLQDLTRVEKAAQVLNLLFLEDTRSKEPGPRAVFFSLDERRDPALHLRLARVYAACFPRPGRGSLGWCESLPDWLGIFLQEVWSHARSRLPGEPPSQTLDNRLVEEMLRLAGERWDHLLLFTFAWTGHEFQGQRHCDLLRRLPGFVAGLERFRELLDRLLAQEDPKISLGAFRLMLWLRVPVEGSAARLVQLAISVGDAESRKDAGDLLAWIPSAVGAPLRQLVSQGRPEERARAVVLLWQFEGEKAADFLRSRLPEEPSEKVRAAIQERLATLEAAPGWPGLPPLPEVPLHSPLSDSLRQALLDLYSGPVGDLLGSGGRLRDFQAETLRFLECGRLEEEPPHLLVPQGQEPREGLEAGMVEILRHPDLAPVQAVRLLALRRFVNRQGASTSFWEMLGAYMEAREGIDVRSVARILEALGAETNTISSGFLTGPLMPPEIPARFAWTYFAERIPLLEQGLGLRGGDSQPWKAMRILEAFPYPPPSLEPYLWRLALGPHKAQRAQAQVCLRGAPGRDSRLLEALAEDGRPAEMAADWLGRLGVRQAAPAIRAALDRAQAESSRAVFMKALELLDERPAEISDRGALLLEARKAMTGARPSALADFPWNEVPGLRWNEDDAVAEGDLAEALVRHTFRLKQIEPSPLLRNVLSQVQSAEALGELALRDWLRRVDASGGKGAGDARGLLALSAASAGRRTAPVAGSYLKRRDAHKQSLRYLLELLSWVDHPSAVQLLMNTAERHRIESIRNYARKLSLTLAERRGWTLEELADRTIPDAGMGAGGLLELETGLRRFTLELGSGLELHLTDEAGRELKSVPALRKGEDAERHKSVKDAVKALRAELAEVVRTQADRLYEAMCTQREWRFEDWRACYQSHPVMGRLVQRLIWTGPTSFRALEDGSLTDVQDEEVVLEAEEGIRLAHHAVLPPGEADAWVRHLADYRVDPLFDQFDRSAGPLAPAAIEKGILIREVHGRVLPAGRLRSETQKLHYRPGPIQDGSSMSFYDFRRTFTAAGLDALIDFSGTDMYLSDPDEPVTLWGVSFERTGATAGGLPLAEVPPVLLYEVRRHARQIAAAGGA